MNENCRFRGKEQGCFFCTKIRSFINNYVKEKLFLSGVFQTAKCGPHF